MPQPDTGWMIEKRSQNLTYGEMATLWHEETGELYSAQALRMMASRLGITDAHIRYTYQPEDMTPHQYIRYSARLLRARYKQLLGARLIEWEAMRLPAWLEHLRARRLMVAFDRDTLDGWIEIHIDEIDLDEFPESHPGLPYVGEVSFVDGRYHPRVREGSNLST